jgi:hypothetical protein
MAAEESKQILGVTCNKRVTKQSTDRGGEARDLF